MLCSQTNQISEKFLFRVSVLRRFCGAAMHIFTTEAPKDGNAESYTTEQFFRKADLIHYSISLRFDLLLGGSCLARTKGTAWVGSVRGWSLKKISKPKVLQELLPRPYLDTIFCLSFVPILGDQQIALAKLFFFECSEGF